MKTLILLLIVLSTAAAKADQIKFFQVANESPVPTLGDADARFETIVEHLTSGTAADDGFTASHYLNGTWERRIDFNAKKHTISIYKGDLLLHTQPIADSDIVTFRLFMASASSSCPIILRLAIKDYSLREMILVCKDF